MVQNPVIQKVFVQYMMSPYSTGGAVLWPRSPRVVFAPASVETRPRLTKQFETIGTVGLANASDMAFSGRL